MGQVIGRSPLPTDPARLFGLPKSVVYEIWDAFNDIAEGFGLSLDEFRDIVRAAARKYLDLPDLILDNSILATFTLLDNDKNNLIDSFEALSAFAFLSNMNHDDKIRFVFSLFDFNSTGQLSVDEVVLAFRSTISGLTKLSEIRCPPEAELERIGICAFSSSSSSSATSNNIKKISLQDFIAFCNNSPEVSNWTRVFDSSSSSSSQSMSHLTSATSNTTTASKPLKISGEIGWNIRLNRLNDVGSVRSNSQLLSMSLSNCMMDYHLKKRRSRIDVQPPRPWENYVIDSPSSSSFPFHVSLSGLIGLNCHVNDVVLYLPNLNFLIHPAGCALIFTPVNSPSSSPFLSCLHSDEVNCLTGIATSQTQSLVISSSFINNPSSSASSTIIVMLVNARFDCDYRVVSSSCSSSSIVKLQVMNKSRNLYELVSCSSDGVVCWYSVQLQELEGEDEVRIKSIELTARSSSSASSLVTDLTISQSSVICISPHSLSYHSDGHSSHVIVKDDELTSVLCSSSSSSSYHITGTKSGRMFIWERISIVSNHTHFHHGRVTCLKFSSSSSSSSVNNNNNNILLSSDEFGKIIVWTWDGGLILNLTNMFSMDSTISISSLCPLNNEMVMLATIDGRSVKMNYVTGRTILDDNANVGFTHTRSGLTGLSPHPYHSHLILTSHQNGSVIEYDVNTNCMVKKLKLPNAISSVSYKIPDADVICVGIGSQSTTTSSSACDIKEGSFMILSTSDLTLVYEARDSKCAISVTCWSPNGVVLAIGCIDGLIYLYNAEDNYIPLAKLKGSTVVSPVLSVDFDLSSRYLTCFSTNGQVNYFQTSSFTQVTHQQITALMTDGELSWSTCCGLNIKSIWNKDDLSHMTQYSRNSQSTGCIASLASEVVNTSANVDSEESSIRPTCVCKSNSKVLLASGYQDGRIIVSNPTSAVTLNRVHVPGSALESNNNRHVGIARICFNCDDSKLIAVGSNDGMVSVWNVFDKSSVSSTTLSPPQTDMKEMKLLMNNSSYNPLFALVASTSTSLIEPIMDDDDDDDVGKLNKLYPWQRSIVPPTSSSASIAPNLNYHLEMDNIYNFNPSLICYSPSSLPITGIGKMIILSSLSSSQRYYNQHRSTITCLACSSSLIASASLSSSGIHTAIMIWDTTTLSTIVFNQLSFNYSQVIKMSFSSSSSSSSSCKYLYVVAEVSKLSTLPHKYELLVYGALSGLLLSSIDLTTTEVYSLTTMSCNQVAVTGLHCINFYSLTTNMGYELTCTPVDYHLPRSETIKSQAFLSSTSLSSSRLVVGCFDGSLYVVNNCILEFTVPKAHTHAVTCLTSSPTNTISGSYDGAVKLWSANFSCLTQIALNSNPIVSLCLNAIFSSCLISTSNVELYEVNSSDLSPINHSFNHKPIQVGHLIQPSVGVYGFAAHPIKVSRFATVGDDGYLSQYEVDEKQVVSRIKLEMPSRAIAYSPDGRCLVVGFGSLSSGSSKNKRSFDGKWSVFNSDDVSKIIHEARDSQKYICLVKYSPSGQFLAIASSDMKIYLYLVESNYTLTSTLLSSSITTHIDFSIDSTYMQVNNSAYELAYYEVDTGLHIPAASRLRDVVWKSATCTMNWNIQGLWSGSCPPLSCSDVNLFRQPNCHAIAGDVSGRVVVSNWPIISSTSASSSYSVHTTEVTSISYVSGDEYLISIGALDGAIVQWKLIRDDKQEDEEGKEEKKSLNRSVPVNESKNEEGLVEENYYQSLLSSSSSSSSSDLANLKSNRSWLSSIIEPDSINSSKQEEEEAIPDLSLHTVHGVSNQVVRNSIYYNANGDVIYPTGSLVIIYNKLDNHQVYFSGHLTRQESDNDDHSKKEEEEDGREGSKSLGGRLQGNGCMTVSCVAVSPDGLFGISSDGYSSIGRRKIRPRILIWDAINGNMITCLFPNHKIGVLSLRMSKNNHFLISLGLNKSLCLFRSFSGNWLDGEIISSISCQQDGFVWFADILNTANDEVLAVSGGSQHVKFWNMINNNQPDTLNCQYYHSLPNETAMCVCSMNKKRQITIVGTNLGYLLQFEVSELGIALMKKMKAHETNITCLSSAASSFCSASVDGVINIYSDELSMLLTIDTPAVARPIAPICTTARGMNVSINSATGAIKSILMSYSSGEVFEVSTSSSSFTLLQEGHGNAGELWGLTSHPTDADLFVTGGDDKTVRVWSIFKKRCIRKAILDTSVRSLAWSPDGNLLTLGLGGYSKSGGKQKKDGAFVVLSYNSLKPIFEGRDCRHWIRQVKFSPIMNNGYSMCLGSMDFKIYVYQVNAVPEVQLTATFSYHHGPIINLDWSTNGQFIASNSMDGTIGYIDVNSSSQVMSSSLLRNEQWSNFQSLYGHASQAIWPSTQEREEYGIANPTSLIASKSSSFAVVGDECGDVLVYRYPVVFPSVRGSTVKGRQQHKAMSVHASEVAGVVISCNNKYAISIGKFDKNIIVWKIN